MHSGLISNALGALLSLGQVRSFLIAIALALIAGMETLTKKQSCKRVFKLCNKVSS